MINFTDAIYKLNQSVVTIRGDVAYDKDENIVEYDKAAVEAYVAANAYKTKRAKEYPSYADQFDTIFHEGLDAWKANIQAVKNKYPKGA
jgi:ribosome-interacting GTPase 1